MAEYDVLMVSDLRLPGGTTTSMAEEIRAQAAAGYRTALLHVDSSVSRYQRRISPRLTSLVDEGSADLVFARDEVHARHAIVRHPLVAQQLGVPPRLVTVDEVSIIVNRPLRTRLPHSADYDPGAAAARVAEWFGRQPVLRPVGPAVRRQLADATGVEVAGDDWPSVIDLNMWPADRENGVRGVPVIGRHTLPDPEKWPVGAAELLDAYPDSDDVAVRILGGAAPAAGVLGRVPQRWLVEPYDARDVAAYLAELDFFVFYHDPRWVEPFGRAVLEALASGVVAILPDQFRETFGDAAVYTPAAGVRAIVQDLSADRDAYRAQSKVGRDFAVTRHGYHVHRERLADLVGPPAAADSTSTWRASRPAQLTPGSAGRARARVLFVSSNGTGMGHLSRLLAMATRAGERIEPFFFSLSSAVPVVAKFGFTWEYCPSRDDLDVPSREWNPFFANRFAEVVRRFQPKALVFDGTWPYQGLGEARRQFPDLRYVWSRRGMWHEGHRTDSLAKSSWFDLVIEPGEFAAEFDRGPTAAMTDAHRVGPMTVIDRDNVLDRDRARAELGIDAGEVAVLAALGAGNAYDVEPHMTAIADAVGSRAGWHVYAPRAAISRSFHGDRRLRTISVFPLAKYLRAFDFGVVACGYNTYHEALLAALPSVFVPQPKITDDQYARARYAEHVGAGLCVEEVTANGVSRALDRLADASVAERFRARCLELYPDNGAARAMELVEQLLVRHEVIT